MRRGRTRGSARNWCVLIFSVSGGGNALARDRYTHTGRMSLPFGSKIPFLEQVPTIVLIKWIAVGYRNRYA